MIATKRSRDCAWCEKNNVHMKCSKCSIYYCNIICAESDYNIHRHLCGIGMDEKDTPFNNSQKEYKRSRNTHCGYYITPFLNMGEIYHHDLYGQRNSLEHLHMCTGQEFSFHTEEYGWLYNKFAKFSQENRERLYHSIPSELRSSITYVYNFSTNPTESRKRYMDYKKEKQDIIKLYPHSNSVIQYFNEFTNLYKDITLIVMDYLPFFEGYIFTDTFSTPEIVEWYANESKFINEDLFRLIPECIKRNLTSAYMLLCNISAETTTWYLGLQPQKQKNIISLFINRTIGVSGKDIDGFLQKLYGIYDRHDDLLDDIVTNAPGVDFSSLLYEENRSPRYPRDYYEQLAHLLLSLGACPNYKKDDHTVIRYVVRNERLIIAKLLHDYGAILDSKITGGDSVLHQASINGDCMMLRWLLNKGCDINTKSSNGKTALDMCNSKRNLSTRRLLECWYKIKNIV